MNILSRIHAARPWQLLCLFAVAMTVGLLLFLHMPADIAILPDPQQFIIKIQWRTWQVCWFVFLGLVLEMVVFYRSRPGDTPDLAERMRREMRRVIFVSAVVCAGCLGI